MQGSGRTVAEAKQFMEELFLMSEVSLYVQGSGRTVKEAKQSMEEFLAMQGGRYKATWERKVDIRLPGKGNSSSHGARPVY